MNEFKKILSILLTAAVLGSFTACDDYEDTYLLAYEECEKVAEEYFDALKEGDYDTMAELSFYEEDYSNLHDYSRLNYELDDRLCSSSDSYNGYYISCSYFMNGRSGGCLIYFSYIKAQRRWMINVIESDYGTVTYSLEHDLFGE